MVLDRPAAGHHADSSVVEMVIKGTTVSACEDVRAWDTTNSDLEGLKSFVYINKKWRDGGQFFLSLCHISSFRTKKKKIKLKRDRGSSPWVIS